MNAKRGYVPEDERNFSPEALAGLRTASRQVLFLINEGYDLKQATTFVGNHYLLSERQRLAIMRSVATEKQLAARAAKEVPMEVWAARASATAARAAEEVPLGTAAQSALAGQEVWIDGFNIIITLEVLLSGSFLFAGMDGAIRDLAALRGTYRIIPETTEAVRILFCKLGEAGIRKVNILLDEPVSNSGRLKALLAESAADFSFALDIQICRDVDRKLYGKENVLTSDAIILDHCASWVNLTAEYLRRQGQEALRVWEQLPFTVRDNR